MKPIQLTIAGSYWDSQIYSGELMLLGDDGSISVVDWGAAVDDFSAQHVGLQTAIRLAFAESNWFYHDQTKRLLKDMAIEKIVRQQLDDLAKLPPRTVDFASWEKFWRQDDSPFDELPTDTDVYSNRMYAATDEGLFSAPRYGLLQDAELTKHHDAQFLRIAGSDGYKSLAAAAGDDGLFEFAFEFEQQVLKLKPMVLSKKPCTSCDWAFQSVVGWSATDAVFANFTEYKDKKTSRVVRSAGDVFPLEKVFDGLFKPSGLVSNQADRFVWGSREKLYRATHTGIEVSDYFGSSWVKKPPQKIAKEQIAKSPFMQRGLIKSNIQPNTILAASTAPFGAVIEQADQLTVIASDGNEYVYSGELVHWRVFPRSTHYSNQLHLIYEDRMEIVSFVHDYFENQEDKLAGFAK
jgi:hypothetical protein